MTWVHISFAYFAFPMFDLEKIMSSKRSYQKENKPIQETKEVKQSENRQKSTVNLA